MNNSKTIERIKTYIECEMERLDSLKNLNRANHYSCVDSIKREMKRVGDRSYGCQNLANTASELNAIKLEYEQIMTEYGFLNLLKKIIDESENGQEN